MRTVRRFATYPSAFVYDSPDRKASGKPDGKVIEDLLWGDYVGVASAGDAESVNGFDKVQIRGKRVGWMEPEGYQRERLLEVIFVDIGQGDGCLMITPDHKFFVIDAGERDNMYRFLRWRFKFDRQDEPISFTGILTHPDKDHYAGFASLFEDDNVRFSTLYHNGIIEQRGDDPLGAEKKFDGDRFITGLRTTTQEMRDFLDGDSWRHPTRAQYNKQYPKTLNLAHEQDRFDEITALDSTTNNGFLPGYEEDQEVSIRILGPLLEDCGDGDKGLRWLGSKGKTKNGHSVVLRLQYDEVSVLLGGDLNIESEKLLLSHHTGLQIPRQDQEAEWVEFQNAARAQFQVDVAKSCHHGSADFYRPYLAASNPIVTVISSGDNESHSHPRADTLGTVGKYSRGVRSLIFNTELARSSGETLEIPMSLRSSIESLGAEIDDVQDQLDSDSAELTADAEEMLRDKLEDLQEQRERRWLRLARSIDVYGAINLRTDGKRILMAQKLERKRGNVEWDIYRLEKEPGDTDFTYQSKYE